jgi:hypothetical protein
MSQDQPTGDFRILVEPDTRTQGKYVSATSQAGARAGSITPSQATSMALVSSGTIDASIDCDATILTHRAGSPEALGATYRWTAGGYTFSWDPPTAISDWEILNRTTTAGYWAGFQAVRLPSGLVAAVSIKTSSDVVVWYEGLASSWVQVTVRSGATAPQACLCVTPGGRVLCFSTHAESASKTQIRMHYSDDSGASWSTGATNVLDAPIVHASSTINRIRAAYLNGQIALFVWCQDTNDIIQHWAGDGSGSSMTKIETFSSADRAAVDAIAYNGEILVAMIEKLDSGTYSPVYGPRLYRLGSAFQALTTSSPVLACSTSDATEWGIYSAGAFTSAECAIAADDDGTLYLYGRGNAAATYGVTVAISTTAGATWTATYQSRGPALGLEIYNTGDATTYMRDLAVAPERGRVLLFHRFVAAGTTADDLIAVAYLGGYSNVPMPDDGSADLGANVAGWGTQYLAVNLPTDVSGTWASSTTGSPANTLGTNGLRTTTAGGEKQKWTATPTIDSGKEGRGILATIRMDVDSGNGVFEVRASNATNSFWVRVTVSTTAITLRDIAAAADIATISTTDGTSGVEVRVALGQPNNAFSTNVGYCQAWYRSAAAIRTDSLYQPRPWTSIGGSTTLTKDSSTTSLVSFENATGASDITWRWVAYTSGTYVGPSNCYDAATVRGRFFGSSATAKHLFRGSQINAVSGPTVRGDTWTLATTYDYGVANLDPFSAPSPRRPWRSTSVGADQDITLTLDMGLVAGDLIGVYLQGCNFKTAALYQDSGATTKIADVSLLLKGGLSFDRTRDLITPKAAVGSVLGTPAQEHRLAGCYWVDSVGGTPRLISTNTSGDWLAGAVTGYRPTRLTLDSYGGGDLSTGAAGQIWSDRVLIITQLTTSTNTLTLRIPYLANAGVSSYFTIGTMAVGRVHVLGPRDYAYRSWTTYTGTERVEGRYGSTHSRRVLPARLSVDLPFTDGYTTDAEWAGSANYLTMGYTSAAPISKVRVDVPGRVEGMLRRAGQLVPVVYAPDVAQVASAPTATTPIQVNDPQRLLWAWIETDTFQTDVVVGDEMTNELVRCGTVRLLEVV